MASHDAPCQAIIEENLNADIICEHVEKTATECTFRAVVWQRQSIQATTNITDSSKYGLWQALPSWGIISGDHVALLRIRNIQRDDIGRYRCQVVCSSKTHLVTTNHMVDLCLKLQSTDWGQF